MAITKFKEKKMKASNKTGSKKILSLLSLLLLTAAIAFFAVSCDGEDLNKEENTTAATTLASSETGTTAAPTEADTPSNVRGEGSTEFVFKVCTASDELKTYTVRTDKKTVGEALLDAGLIEGEDGPYGLYVKIVDGERHEYEDDGMYWAFYENDAYALKGVDSAEIKAGVEYSFKAAKG